jgi:hypothetical protein
MASFVDYGVLGWRLECCWVLVRRGGVLWADAAVVLLRRIAFMFCLLPAAC